jgi:hypothetical protein
MTAIRLSLAALLAGALSASTASAQCYPCIPPPCAPNACGPGNYCQNWCGMTYGPGYNLYPPFPPFQGMIPGPPQQGNGNGNGDGMLNSPVFPTHPYARSPRDYFMIYERGIDEKWPY